MFTFSEAQTFDFYLKRMLDVAGKPGEYELLIMIDGEYWSGDFLYQHDYGSREINYQDITASTPDFVNSVFAKEDHEMDPDEDYNANQIREYRLSYYGVPDICEQARKISKVGSPELIFDFLVEGMRKLREKNHLPQRIYNARRHYVACPYFIPFADFADVERFEFVGLIPITPQKREATNL